MSTNRPPTLEDAPKRSQRRNGGTKPQPAVRRQPEGLFNAVSVLFLIATVAVIVFSVLIAQNPGAAYNPLPPGNPEPTATLLIIPGLNAPEVVETPTPDAVAEQPDTSPEGGGSTGEAVPNPPDPVQPTPIPQPTQVNTGPEIVNTPAAFPFTLENDEVEFIRNQNSSGCAWSSIAGQVTGLRGEPLTGYFVSVTASEQDFSSFQQSGSEPRYGSSGYEIVVNRTPLEEEYVVRLLNTNGVPLSEPIIVRSETSCDRNVAVVNFVQNREFAR